MNKENMWNFYVDEFNRLYPEAIADDPISVNYNYDGVMEEIEDIEILLKAEKYPISEHRGMECRTCHGTGQVTYSVNQSPLGSGEYWPMMMYDPCPNCIEKGKCPKCGYYNGFENQDSPLKCVKCGWDEDKTEG